MDLENICRSVTHETNSRKLVILLQKATLNLLENYCCSIDGITFRPIELESYCFKSGSFEDPYVHSNELQKNHFGEFYVHRRGQTAASPYKMDNRVCVGISLSTDESYYYSALIRSVVFEDGTHVYGPNNVLCRLMSRVNRQKQLLPADFFDTRHEGTFEMSKLFPAIEGKKVLEKCGRSLSASSTDRVFFSTRVGIAADNKYYHDLPLRALRGGLTKEYLFKEKTIVLKHYLSERGLRGEQAVKEARTVFGSAPKSVIDSLK